MIVRLPPVLELIQREYIGEWKPEWGLTENGKPHPGNFTYRLLKNEEPFTHSGSIVADFAERFMKHVWTIITFGPDKRIQTDYYKLWKRPTSSREMADQDALGSARAAHNKQHPRR